MVPLPLMVSTPSSERVQLTPSPQLPDDAARTSVGANKKAAIASISSKNTAAGKHFRTILVMETLRIMTIYRKILAYIE